MKMKLLSVILIALIFILMLEGCKKEGLSPREGYVEVDRGKIWFRIYGEGNKTPMLVLHGGPGSSSYGLIPLKALSNDRPVIFYDQLGCGRSSRITDTTLMTIDHYVEELEQLRKALDLNDFCLYGQSWGPALGFDYYLKYPKEVKALIFSSPLLSTDLWIKDADTLISTLPDSIQVIIRENEKNKTFNNDAYKNAVKLYYSKFLRRRERSKEKSDSAELFFGKNVYEYMWGPSEFTATGTLLHYDRVDRLKEIAVPTLLLTGEYDEARPVTVRYFQSLIPSAEFTVIKNSGHATIHDNPEQTLSRLNDFLLKVDELTYK
jgi:proline iminopeptidase